MNPIKISGICLSLFVLSGCSDDPEPKKPLPPLVVDTTERLAPVTLKIPGVGDEEEVAVLKMPDGGDTANGKSAEANVASANAADASAAGATGDATQAAAKGQPVATVDIPRPLLLSEVVHSRFSDLLQGPSNMPIIDAVFYPLGWSKDGKFAYAVEPPDEAVGSYFLNVYVQDLVTDKILWQDKYQSPPESNEGFQSFAAYWTNKEKPIKARFDKFGIAPIQDSVLFAGSIKVGNDQISYQVQKKFKAQPDFGNIAVVANYGVEVVSATRGKKSVHKESYKAMQAVLDVDVIGYLRSDDPERVALLVGGVRRGWEGPPHVTWFKVIGTNLKRGFKK